MVKSGRFYSGIEEAAFRRLCIHLAPVKMYTSVLDFPHTEIIGRKCKLHYLQTSLSRRARSTCRSAGILSGDVPHGRPGVCFTCLERARWLITRAAETIEWYYQMSRSSSAVDGASTSMFRTSTHLTGSPEWQDHHEVPCRRSRYLLRRKTDHRWNEQHEYRCKGREGIGENI